jgi:hypothetical protein
MRQKIKNNDFVPLLGVKRNSGTGGKKKSKEKKWGTTEGFCK